MSLSAGAIVGDKVRLLRPLKRGGMGSVWLAEHLTLRTQVAIKFMSERLAQDQEYVARFTREATASAQIKSPNVVQVFDHGIAPDGTPYIVMELLEGEDLRVRLSRVGTLGLGEAATVVVHVARALSKAHSFGIVHRDIKPDNVFLTDQDGELFVKVLDFGIAKHTTSEAEALDGMTGTGAMVGTPHYMSPEQILSARRVDHRADLWSVGVVMYRSLTGHVPFQGETLGAVCIAIERGTFVPASQRRPDIPPSVDAWFTRALARDPAHRFQSAKELADAFLAALAMGGHPAMTQPYRIDTASAPVPRPLMMSQPGGVMPPQAAAGFLPGMTPPPGFGAPQPAVTPPPELGTGSGRFPSFADAPWAASDVATSPPQPQTFHGSSVTHAEWKSSSRRRAVVTLVSAVLGIVVLLAIVVAVLMKGPDVEPEIAEATPTAPAAATAAPLPEPATERAAEPASVATAAPSASQAVAPEPSATPAPPPPPPPKPIPTSTGKPKRDRGF